MDYRTRRPEAAGAEGMPLPKQSPDLAERILPSVGQFKGKTRLADFIGRLCSARHDGRGQFPLDREHTVTVDLNDRIQRLMWGGAYEPHVVACLKMLLKPGDTFVDIGAHIGFFSLL